MDIVGWIVLFAVGLIALRLEPARYLAIAWIVGVLGTAVAAASILLATYLR